MQFHQPVTAYALQVGGWLPLAFVSASILLVDRNIVGLIDQIAKNSMRSDVAANKWWFEFINSSSAIINPILCAMEGGSQRVPTLGEFCEEFERACSTLRRGFPKSRIVTLDYEQLERAYSIVSDLAQRHETEVEFLRKVAPLIVNRCADRDTRRIEDAIFAIARDVGIVGGSLVQVAALACLYESGDGTDPNIARRVLKPTGSYTALSAHNALSDIRTLELLVALSSMQGPSFAYCTRDKYLAAFWCAIQAREANREGGDIVFQLTLARELFPRLSDDRVCDLMRRIQGY